MYDIHFGFRSSDPQDQAIIDQIIAYRRSRTSGVPIDLIRDVKRTKAGRTFVVPVAQAMVPDRAYTAAELGALLGGGMWTPRKVGSVLTVLGRPESRHRSRIFQRPSDGKYALSAAMRDAILSN